MKRLIILIGAIGLLICLTYLVLTTIADTFFSRHNSYMAMSLKKEALLKSTPSPRFLLLGGSNLLFGFDSALLKKQTGRNVVNMGLHAGLGLPFLLNESVDEIKAGDIVLLCPEYYLEGGSINAQVELSTTNPKAVSYLNFNLFDRIRFYATRFQKSISVPISYIGEAPKVPKTYSLDNLNEFGDIKRLYPEDKKTINFSERFTSKDYSKYVDLINDFVRTAQAKGAIVYVTFPALAKSEYELNQRAIAKAEALINQSVKAPTIGRAVDFVYPDDHFFDTIYHLDSISRIDRTAKVVELLKGSD